jgi:hypothetical protein
MAVGPGAEWARGSGRPRETGHRFHLARSGRRRYLGGWVCDRAVSLLPKLPLDDLRSANVRCACDHLPSMLGKARPQAGIVLRRDFPPPFGCGTLEWREARSVHTAPAGWKQAQTAARIAPLDRQSLHRSPRASTPMLAHHSFPALAQQGSHTSLRSGLRLRCPVGARNGLPISPLSRVRLQTSQVTSSGARFNCFTLAGVRSVLASVFSAWPFPLCAS